MHIRTFRPADVPALVDLTIATFGPFYEDSFRPAVGELIFTCQHGNWREEYRAMVPGLHDPADGKHVAVAEDDGVTVGYVGWKADPARRHGEIEIVAVAATSRRQHVGRSLCEHALAAMRAQDVAVVAVGTGGDAFHAPARALYESLGFTPFPGTYYYRAV